jgi:DNA-binding transcriptional LysR family regulator
VPETERDSRGSTPIRPKAEVADVRGFPSMELCVVLAAGHVLAQRSSVALGDLADETWIAAEPEAICTRATLHACHDAGFVPDIELRTGDFTTACALVAAGLGVALVPVARHIHAALRPHAADQRGPLHADALRCLSAAAAAPIETASFRQ